MTPGPLTVLRIQVVAAFFAIMAAMLVWRLFDLQVTQRAFLQAKANDRHHRVIAIPALRGRILDRHGEPLSISAPVESIWAEPAVAMGAPDARFAALAEALQMTPERLSERLADGASQFVYLRRGLAPRQADRIMAVQAPGVHRQREYRRYYPGGEMAAQLVGFADVDQNGQEGVERMADATLRSVAGRRLVVRDLARDVVADLGVIDPPRRGGDVRLTVDKRLQYLLYRELKAAVMRHRARAGMAILIDAGNGDVLAAVNQPSFNPNDRDTFEPARVRNRVFTDAFEPGSTMKPLVVLSALTSDRFRPDSVIKTAPGRLRIGAHQVVDRRNHGALTPAAVIAKSSNVGAAKIALALPPGYLHERLTYLGFNRRTAVRFAGETGGVLHPYSQWGRFGQATLSFGYGVSVSAAQLAAAYQVLANDGVACRLRLLRSEPAHCQPSGFRPRDAAAVRRMMEAVATPSGTAPKAAIPGYRVAGKTGTVRVAVAGGYAEDRYRALFVGMAPARRPRLVAVVVVEEPTERGVYGGKVAAPVFARALAPALRLLNIEPSASSDLLLSASPEPSGDAG